MAKRLRSFLNPKIRIVPSCFRDLCKEFVDLKTWFEHVSLLVLASGIFKNHWRDPVTIRIGLKDIENFEIHFFGW